MTTLVEQPRRPYAASCAAERRAPSVAPGAGLDCTDHKFYQWPITQWREADRALFFPIPHFARAYDDAACRCLRRDYYVFRQHWLATEKTRVV